MKKPIIGIISKFLKVNEFYGWSWQRINNQLRYALCKNGANVLGILPQAPILEFQSQDEHDETVMSEDEKNDLIHFIGLCDGIVLQGGVNSAYYEEFVAKYCFDNNIPVLGICAGYNTIIRALGGTTKKLHDDDRHDRPDLKFAHKCIVTDKTSLFAKIVKQDEFDVNSIHSYVGDVIPNSLSIVARSDDDQVEVVEAKNKKLYMGINYHPELFCDSDENQNDIFKNFIESTKH